MDDFPRDLPRGAPRDFARGFPGDFPRDAIALDRAAEAPLQAQLFQQLSGLMRAGRLGPGMALPSTRALAAELGVSRNTVSWVFERLTVEGYLVSRPGAASRVAARAGEAPMPGAAGLLPADCALPPGAGVAAPPRMGRRAAAGAATRIVVDPLRLLGTVERAAAPTPGNNLASGRNLAPGAGFERGARLLQERVLGAAAPGMRGFRPFHPDVREFPFKTWSRLVARRCRSWGEEFFGYGHFAGFAPLRQAIAEYIGANRGVRCHAGQVIITNGSQGALDLLARVLLRPGDPLWMEEPGYTGAHATFVMAGARPLPLQVGLDGRWQLDALPAEAPRLIYVTPSCQQPLCAVMQAPARRQLLDIAARHDAWIIEDDFDNEFRAPAQYVPAVQGMGGPEDMARTIYLGSFSKTLFPALRLGFMVLPEALCPQIAELMFLTGHFTSLPMQAALCDFIVEGHFARHLRRMRRVYAERRRRMMALVDQECSDWLRPLRSAVGIQVPYRLRAPYSDQAVALRAREEGLALMPLSGQYHHGAPQQGFVLGHGMLSPAEAAGAVRQLAAVLAASAPARPAAGRV